MSGVHIDSQTRAIFRTCRCDADKQTQAACQSSAGSQNDARQIHLPLPRPLQRRQVDHLHAKNIRAHLILGCPVSGPSATDGSQVQAGWMTHIRLPVARVDISTKIKVARIATDLRFGVDSSINAGALTRSVSSCVQGAGHDGHTRSRLDFTIRNYS